VEPFLREAVLQVVLRYEEDYARTGNATYKDFHVAFYDLPGSQGYVRIALCDDPQHLA